MIALRPYQITGVTQIRAAYSGGARAVLFVSPTGSGKTVVFCYIAQNARARGTRTWILVHREELLNQTSRALDMLGVPHGLIAPGYTPSGEGIQVASVNTLVRRVENGRVGDVDLIVIDEAHHTTAGTWKRILQARPKARLLGVTATPARLDGQGLGVHVGGVFDALVMGPSVRELIDDGYLCRPAVYAPPTGLDLSDVRMRGGDYATGELVRRVDKPTITGDAVAHYRKLCDGAPAIAFCASVEHAKHVAHQFRAAGYQAERIEGNMPDGQRRGLIDALGDGRLHVLTSCEIVSEGTDIPVVAAAILLRPTASMPLYLQQVGRALRPVYPQGADLSTREGRLAAIAASIKPRAIILDHVGNVFRHGMPDETREWTLDGKPRTPGKGKAQEPDIRVKQCPRCYAAHAPAPVCPACGYQYQPENIAPRQVEGELREVTEVQAELLRRERRREVGRAKTLDELRAIAAARGYKPQWAEYVWKARQRKQLTKLAL